MPLPLFHYASRLNRLPWPLPSLSLKLPLIINILLCKQLIEEGQRWHGILGTVIIGQTGQVAREVCLTTGNILNLNDFYLAHGTIKDSELSDRSQAKRFHGRWELAASKKLRPIRHKKRRAGNIPARIEQLRFENAHFQSFQDDQFGASQRK